jgi:PadR family transcriptional regulator
MRGTLELMILRTLLAGPSHGHAIAKHIQRTTDDLLQVETGSLYPALYRLEHQGLIDAQWGDSENNRKAKYYTLTPAGRKRLKEETAGWRKLTSAVDAVLGATPEEV